MRPPVIRSRALVVLAALLAGCGGPRAETPAAPAADPEPLVDHAPIVVLNRHVQVNAIRILGDQYFSNGFDLAPGRAMTCVGPALRATVNGRELTCDKTALAYGDLRVALSRAPEKITIRNDAGKAVIEVDGRVVIR